MKKSLKTVVFTALAAIMLFAFAACTSSYKEVAGTYEMTSISGNIGGVSISTSTYEYFRIILDEEGNGTVQSKASGIGAAKYEAKGTYVYEDGKIRLTTTSNGSSVTEVYDYADGVITYSVDMEQMKFTIKLARVAEE